MREAGTTTAVSTARVILASLFQAVRTVLQRWITGDEDFSPTFNHHPMSIPRKWPHWPQSQIFTLLKIQCSLLSLTGAHAHIASATIRTTGVSQAKSQDCLPQGTYPEVVVSTPKTRLQPRNSNQVQKLPAATNIARSSAYALVSFELPRACSQVAVSIQSGCQGRCFLVHVRAPSHRRALTSLWRLAR